MKSGKKIIKILLSIVILVPVLFLVFNYYLAYRLENYLREELANRVSVATDHFYVLSFDGLSVNLLNGALRIEGIELRPDSNVFNQWKSLDSLPETYLRAKIDVVDFKGVNLIWRWSYKRLNFNTFEIQSPVLEVYTSGSFQADLVEDTQKTKLKPLYELMEPYINVLTVGSLNLEHAIISYNVKDSLSPIVYKLDDVSFHAYGFRLDSLSYSSGKLLYSNNFDFVTNKRQTLLTNNEFLLLTDSIRLSTQDSIIYLKNIHLVPQEELWNETNKKPSNYVNGQIHHVKVDGIAFTREKALNYLEASSFGVYSPDIRVYSLDSKDKSKSKSKKGASTINTDSLMQALSLYDLISPILHSVAIDQISLENTTADCFFAFNDSIETYHLDNFDFHAYHFLVDSLSDAENIFWYSKNFAFEAKGLEAMLKARNHKVSVGRVVLDTEKKYFSIENVHLSPISTQTLNDYMEGDVRSLNIKGLIYDDGVSADLFEIESPAIRYVRTPQKKEDTEQVDDKSQVDIRLLLNPLFSYLSIHSIRINGANASFANRNENDTITYKINDFNFYATDFLINEKTIGRKNNLFFDFKEFGFDFRNFDNLLDKDYKVTIGNTVFSSVAGLRLEDVELIPRKTTEMYVSLKAPLIELLQPAWALSTDNFLFKMKSVSLDHFRMKNAEVGFNYKSMQLNQKVDIELEGFHYDNDKQFFEANNIYFNTKNINIALDGDFYNLHVGDILFDHRTLKLEDIRLESPYSKEEFAFRHPKHSDWMGVSVGSFSLNEINLPTLVKNKILTAGSATVDHVTLEIYKNKQIPVLQKFKPMIYGAIQKAPLKMNIDSVTVRHMNLVYEELSLKGTQPGKLFFTEINGVFSDFTNIVKQSDQYIDLKANAKFMDDGFLTADWRIPVDSLNDSFLLDAHMSKFNFATLNAMITPAAPVSIRSGKVNDLTFSIKGTSLLADIQMELLYDSLKVDLLKEKKGELVERNMLSGVANMVVRDSNPRHKNGKPHLVNVSAIERDVYRSTFNFIWTILRPAMADAVGISETGQHVAGDAVELMKKIKSFFHHEKKEEDVEKQEEQAL